MLKLTSNVVIIVSKNLRRYLKGFSTLKGESKFYPAIAAQFLRCPVSR